MTEQQAAPNPSRPPALALTLLLLAILPRPVAAQTLQDCSLVAADDTPPTLRPWLWLPDGAPAWGTHVFWEDDAATARVLARDLLRPPGQPGHVPDLLQLNHAQFDPPEGEPAGLRRLVRGSLELKGLQLHVNYSGVPITLGGVDRYPSPTWFVSLPPGHTENRQTEPPVPDLGFGEQLVSATRGAFGQLASAGTAHAQLDPLDDDPNTADALYVSAGIGYGKSALDPDDHALADEICRDRLLVRDPASGRWQDEGWRLPAGAADGNASGVAFADLTGDGWFDLYVGRCGDDHAGAADALLRHDGTGSFVDDSGVALAGHPALATQEVVAHDLDLDGDLDLVVAARCRRDRACGTESEDAVLVNDGAGLFSWQPLAAGALSDSRAVAVADLDQDGRPEIVLGNAGSDGPVDTPLLPATQRHRLQILGDVDPGPALVHADRLTDFMSLADEQAWSAGHTWQVLALDLVGATDDPRANPWIPDGLPDLVLVEHRAILQGPQGRPGGAVVLLANSSPAAGVGGLSLACSTPAAHVSSVALSNLHRDGLGARDLYVATSHPYGGSHPDFQRNIGPLLDGSADTPWDPDPALVNMHRRYDALPGNEHGYGFDVADLDDDGLPEVLQTSRAYNYLVHGLGGEATHRTLSGPSSPTALSNVRGRLSPRALEDGVFADIDGDGRLDLVGASTVAPSPAQSDQTLDASVDVAVFDGALGPADLVHDTHLLTDSHGGPPQRVDVRVDPGGRTAWPRPAGADRVVAGDLDNDGDTDVLAHLFEIRFDAGQPIPPVLPEYGFDLPTQAYAFGWRWLRNVAGEPGAQGLWFRDEAPTRLLDHRSLAYSPAWNRSVGADVLLDVDNNGALDLYTTKGFPADPDDPFSDTVLPEQNDDLLFLNGVQGLAPGTLVELGSLLLPPSCVPLDWDVDGQPDQKSCGSFGVAAGDVDGDGWCDVVVTHASYFQSIPADPWLLINHLGSGGALLDEFAARVPMAGADPVLHSPTHPLEPRPIDHADVPALGDWDGDGDLDLVFSVKDNRPRVWRNRGSDSDGDGWITPADGPLVGHFEDVTAATLGEARRPTVDGQDLAFHDLDGDGDLDLVLAPFDDRLVLWRNGLDPQGRPAVCEVWPRIGALAGSVVELRGARLDGLDGAELLASDGSLVPVDELWPGDASHARLRLPCQTPPGLTRLRVRRTILPPGCDEPLSLWSTLHTAYVVLARPEGRPCSPPGLDGAALPRGPAPAGPLPGPTSVQ